MGLPTWRCSGAGRECPGETGDLRQVAVGEDPLLQGLVHHIPELHMGEFSDVFLPTFPFLTPPPQKKENKKNL